MAATDVRMAISQTLPQYAHAVLFILLCTVYCMLTHNTHCAVMRKSQPQYELDQFKQLLNKILHSDDSEPSVLNIFIRACLNVYIERCTNQSSDEFAQ